MLKLKMVKTIGHRGAGILEPENTINAMRKAIELGLDQAEIDLRITKDKQLVVFHDYSTERVSSKNTLLKDLTFEELKKIKPDIPLLDEVITVADGKISLRLDVKDDIGEELCNFLKQKDFRNCVVMFRNKEELLKVKKLLPKIETAFLVTDPEIDLISGAKEAKADGIHLGSRCVNKKTIDAARKEGLKVAIGEFDTAEDIKEALKFNPDYMSSNRPDLLVKIISKGKK